MSWKRKTNAKVFILDTDAIQSRDDARIYSRKLSNRTLTVLLEIVQSVSWGSRWTTDGEHVQDIYSAIVDELLMPDETADELNPFMHNAQIECEENEEDENMPQYQKFGNSWFIGFPCGDCGGIEWVELGAGSALDPDTNAPLGTENTSVDIPATSETAQPCAAAAVTDYLLVRFRQWNNAAAGVSAIALDELFGPFDEIADIANLLALKADNQSAMNGIMQAGEDELYGNVAAHRNELIAAYPADAMQGRINALEIKRWFRDALGNWSLETQAIDLWLDTSLLFGLSKDIAALIADCEGSADALVPLLPEPTLSDIEDLGDRGDGSHIFKESFSIEVPRDGSTALPKTWPAEVLGVSWQWTSFDGGGLSATIGGGSLSIGSSPLGEKFWAADNQAKNWIEGLTSDVFDVSLVAQTAPVSINTAYACQLEPCPDNVTVTVEVYYTEVGE